MYAYLNLVSLTLSLVYLARHYAALRPHTRSMSAKFIYLVGQVGSFGPCFLVQPELVISCDVTFNLTFIEKFILAIKISRRIHKEYVTNEKCYSNLIISFSPAPMAPFHDFFNFQ